MESGGNVSFLHRFELVFAFVLIYEVCLFELRQNPFTTSEERALGILGVLLAVVGGVEMYVKEKNNDPGHLYKTSCIPIEAIMVHYLHITY